ncbi:MAG: leucine-rich repeat protein [Clostridia bacterium]
MKKTFLRILFVIIIISCMGIFFGCNNVDDNNNEQDADEVNEIEEIIVHIDQNWEDGIKVPDSYYKKTNVIRLPDYEDGYREGYSHRGWYVDKECTIEFISSASKVLYDITDIEEITVYAKWMPIYTVTFNVNGAENELEPINYCIGDSLGLYWVRPQRIGYSFDKWLPKLSVDLYVGDFELTAQWNLLNVDYTSNGDGTCSINCAQDIDNKDFLAKDVEIPSEHMYYEDNQKIIETVTKINDYAFYGCTNIESVSIPDTITEIGDYAFAKSETNIKDMKLSKISVPNSVTAIGLGAFANCSNLIDVNLGNGITFINEDCFYNCALLSHITLPDSILSIKNNAFTNSGIITIQIPENTVDINLQANENAFYNCLYLEEFVVENSNANYSSIDGVLYNKDSTNLLKYPSAKINTEFSVPEAVVEISKMAFECCPYLQNLNLDVNVATIYFNETKEDNSLYSLQVLTNITIDSQNRNYFAEDGILYKNTQIGHKLLFYPCAKTETDIVLDESVTEIGEWAFADSKIINLTMGKKNSYVHIYVHCFENSTIEKFYYRNSDLTNLKDYDYVPIKAIIYIYSSDNNDDWKVANINGRQGVGYQS